MREPCLPGCDRLIGEPDRQTPALAQAGVISRPVRDFVLLARDVTPAGLVELERQGGHPRSEEGLSRTPLRPQHQPASRSVQHLWTPPPVQEESLNSCCA